ncbi:uncharacterized protein PV06_04048 [Exophiala oligosperma]|uniref:Uncharacterized protein n=1 Tax=Exophiala oligosperma TaxID=215243 RepID=A0A0D2C7A1_9EURO|nr:uncharacterized protein PV06_04048 [Exophiala oligosperma]KIW45677.1 hypothetical protein PV06_04048 [Exophiala oligosperma]
MAIERRSRMKGRRINILVYVTYALGPELLPYLLHNPDLNVRVVADFSKAEFQQYMKSSINLDELQWFENKNIRSRQGRTIEVRNEVVMQAHRLARWADLMFVILDAHLVSAMMSGLATDLLLNVLRCWDVTKRVALLPEMSVDQHKHPMWRKQFSKLQTKWDWVHVMPPALWDYDRKPRIEPVCAVEDEDPAIVWDWQGPGEIIETIESEVRTILRSMSKANAMIPYPSPTHTTSKPRLPAEIWTMILENVGDWELATALGIYTQLPTPHEWEALVLNPGSKKVPSLEYTILTQPVSQIKTYFTNNTSSQPPTTLSSIATRLIFRFSMTELLTYLALYQKDIFWTSFGLALLPHKASLIYNSPTILNWWKDCPAVIKKEYGPEALDGASRAGFVEVLDWWLESGLKLTYTEKALESASAKGHVDVLEWWRVNSLKLAGTTREMPLKVGKSILLAAQAGRTNSIEWWENSGIPYAHEDGVARLASAHGHVGVLELWHSFKGSKMIFDNQVLVGATKNGHAGVLQWWKDVSRKTGLRVEYKTCDIEEAMEDAVGGGGESEVREWWGRNGLNLGVGTGEWMRVKTL